MLDAYDDLTVRDDVKITHFSTKPFAISYVITGLLEFSAISNSIQMEFELTTKYPVLFHMVGASLRTSEIKFEKKLTGLIRFSVSGNEIKSENSSIKELVRKTPQHPWASSVLLNLTYSPALENKYYIPMNKIWIDFFGRLFEIPDHENILEIPWDGSFASIIMSRCYPEFAWSNMMVIFESIHPDGRIPQIRIGRDFMTNRTNPPVWFVAIDELFKTAPDVEMMKKLIPLLTKNYIWFNDNRRNSAESGMPHTFSWGTDMTSLDNLSQTKGKLGAMMESGLDDSPIFDDMELKGNLLNYACIDLSCLIYRANEILISWSRNTKLRSLFSAEEIRMIEIDNHYFRKTIHEFFCFEKSLANSFKIIDGKKSFSDTLTPLSFYQLLTSYLFNDEILLLSNLYHSEHFTNRDNPSIVLPSLSFKDKQLNLDGDYWRGRIWPPSVYLAAMGFKNYNITIYKDIKTKAESILAVEWQRHGHVHENYSGLTGKGEPCKDIYARSCPLYSWGGLLGII
ncbi:MAG TPA: hypothetical protein DD381_00385 [Lentisphaeria bacterium]|nr:MAG: hypothetical protein A2X47_05150 [Lentisphaerae bacterium GWF2_38_69]HBM14799.1 hypothetical protein [Lentisphaeria bacterium]